MNDLERLYRDHGPALLAYLRRRFAGRQAAEDLLQETFVQALRTFDRLAQAASPRAWLFGIARHIGLSARRRQREATMPPEQAVTLPQPAQPADERLERMRQAIGRLPDAQREALELRLRDELSYEEIAEVTGVPIGTVRSRLHHAVRSLREMLEREGAA